MISTAILFFFFFFNDTATTEIYTLSLHDALPILITEGGNVHAEHVVNAGGLWAREMGRMVGLELPILAMQHQRSEEHTSELQSRLHLVCRLLLEKKKN